MSDAAPTGGDKEPPVAGPPTWRFWRTMTGRMTLTSMLVAILAITAGGWTLSSSFRSYAVNDLDSRLSAVLDDMIGASEIDRQGTLRFTRPLFDQRFSQPYSGWYWEVLEADRPSFRSRSMWDFELVLDVPDQGGLAKFHQHAGPDEQILRVVEQDISLPEAPGRRFRYIVAADTRELLSAVERFDGLLLTSLGLITLAIVAALILQITFALKPVRRMIQHLVDVRNGERARMADDYPDDVQPLADEIDALIDHNSALVERARTHVGNLAHGLKTPLSVIQNEVKDMEADRADRIRRQLTDVLSLVDQHLRRARVAGGGPGAGVDVSDRLQKITRAIKRLHGDKALDVQFHGEEGLFFDGEQQDFDEVAGNLIENAGKWSQSQVSVEVKRLRRRGERPRLEIRVDDDGVGVPEEERQALFERGKRLDESVPGTGLGLAIVADIVDLYGGAIHLDSSPLGGLMVRLVLPAKPAK